MPRRNSNALKSRTRNRSTTPVKLLRLPNGTETYVTPLTRGDRNGNVLVLLLGSPTLVPGKLLHSV